MDLKVKDAMTKRLVSIVPSECIQGAALALSKSPLTVLLVVENEAVVGLLHAWDIVSGALRTRCGIRRTAVKEIMFKDIVWVNEEEELDNARRSMLANNVRTLLVRNTLGKLVGTFSTPEE